MSCDLFYLLQTFLHFNRKVNSSYNLNDGRGGCCHQVFPFSDMKLCPKRVCFPMKLYRLTSSPSIALNFSVKAGKGCSIMAMRIVICQHQKEPFFPIETIIQAHN